MEHSSLCNFRAGLFYKDNPTREVTGGCKTLKEAKQLANSEKIKRVILYPQTEYAKQRTKGYDYLVVKGNQIVGVTENAKRTRGI